MSQNQHNKHDLQAGDASISAGPPSEAQLREALLYVVDPDMGYSIVELGLVRSFDIDPQSGKIHLHMTLTSPMCPVAPEIMQAAGDALAAVPGVSDVTVNLEWMPPWDPRVDPSEEIRADMGFWL